MLNRFHRDTIFNGILLGVLSITLDYIVLFNIDKLINNITDYGHLLKAPRIQLIILAVNILLFRFLMVRWQKTETGSGVLFAIVVVSMFYIFNYKSTIPTGL